MENMVSEITGQTLRKFDQKCCVEAGVTHTERRDWDARTKLLSSIEKAKRLLEPQMGFEEGLRKVHQWFTGNWENIKRDYMELLNKAKVRIIDKGQKVLSFLFGCTSRTAEYRFVLKNLPPVGSTILDVGCCNSLLEHVGLGLYGDPIHENADIMAVQEIYRILSNT